MSDTKQEYQPILVIAVVEGGATQCSHAVDFAPSDDPRHWGIVLADTIRHIARARSQQYGNDEWSDINAIMKIINDEIEMSRDDPSRGNISGNVVS